MAIRCAVERASTEVERGSTGVIRLLRKCWRRMGLMKLSFERAERSDGTGSRQRSAERRRDEDDWSRMNDEGCPNDGSQPNSGHGGAVTKGVGYSR